MSISLTDIATCFEGVYPSALATRAPDGMPNISYLSHVTQVDDRHVAISNQFFAKTAANVRSDPHATLLVVEPRSGRQYHLALTWTRSVDTGSLFDQLDVQLRASSAQIGMSDIMRLRAVDVFRVETILPAGSEDRSEPDKIAESAQDLLGLAAALSQLSDLTDPAQLLVQLLNIVRDVLGFQHAMVLLQDLDRDGTTAAASIGYEHGGVGAEAPAGVGLIGCAAQLDRTMRVNDVSRVRRMTSAVRDFPGNAVLHSRQVPLPGLDDALSQIAVPMTYQGQVRGVLFVESRDRMGFDNTATAALEILARHAAVLLVLHERLVDDDGVAIAPSTGDSPADDKATIRVVRHRFDHSVFVDRQYVIKGVAGQLFVYMLEQYAAHQQRHFTNRELRLALMGALPDFKDNLETRLLLLRRRLDELQLPIRLLHIGRGRLELAVAGRIELENAD